MRRAVALAVVLSACSALAEDARLVPRAPHGYFLGDDWRYRPTGPLLWLRGVLTRPFLDLVSIPTHYGSWNAYDFTAFAGVLGVGVGLAAPVGRRSLDSRLQDQLHAWWGPNCAYARDTTFCQPYVAPAAWRVWRGGWADAGIIAVATGVPLLLLLGGALFDDGPLVESGTLAIESFLVAEAYHLTLKLVLGREAPLENNGDGTFYGPSDNHFPDGWPSGHAATLFSIAATYAEYFPQVWLKVLLLGVASALSVMLVVDDTHFASEVVVGAAIGYFSGRFVVQHRSSRYRNGDDGNPVRLVALAPMQVPGGYGLGATFTF